MLEGTSTEQEVHDVSFVWLEPIEFDGRDRAEIETVNMHGVD
jgi:hypothetical protein